MISKHVDNFVATRLHITSEDLVNLERAIQGLQPQGQNTNKDDSTSAKNQESSNNKDEVDPESSEIHNQLRFTIPQGAEWNAISILKSIELEEKEKREQEQKRLNQQKMKEFLDKQVEEAHVRKMNERNDEIGYANEVRASTLKFEEEKRRKAKAVEDFHISEQIRFAKEMEEEKKKAQQDLLERQRIEQLELDRIAAIMQEERTVKQKKRAEEQRKNHLIIQENAENEKRKLLARQKEIEENEIIVKQYAAKLDLEARLREEAFQKRLSNLDRFAKWADEEGPLKHQREEEKKFEAMLLNEQLKRNEKEIEREKSDARKREERLRLIKMENKRQMDEKVQKHIDDKLADEQYARERKSDMDNFKNTQSQEFLSLKQKQANQRGALLKQMENRKTLHEDMNLNERQINADAIEKIVHDPHFHSRVCHRLRIGSANGSR